MGLDNPLHIAFLLIVLLLVFGAKRLPEMGRSLGSGLRGFKGALADEPEHATLGSAETTISEHATPGSGVTVPEPAREPAPERLAA
jgi:sec-independent protein translocase protein TatA